jgi:hypothetical protein
MCVHARRARAKPDPDMTLRRWTARGLRDLAATVAAELTAVTLCGPALDHIFRL